MSESSVSKFIMSDYSVSESSLTGSSVSEFSVVWGSFVLESGGSLCQSLLCQIVRVRRVNGNILLSHRVYFL